MKRVILYFLLGIVTSAFAQNNQLIINADLGTETINKNIYGHFAEHLGKEKATFINSFEMISFRH